MIDVSNASPTDLTKASLTLRFSEELQKGTLGNYGQKYHPVNPVGYLLDRGISSIFRYIQTHPDMDHLDGIKAFFEEFAPVNFWDTNNSKEMESSSWENSPYSKEDWNFYKGLRDGNPSEDPRRLALLSGDTGPYWNDPGVGAGSGDGLHILAPTPALVLEANISDDYNRCSYVILYSTEGRRVVFAGDSHDRTWEHILENHAEHLHDIDLLIAPHHGRDSDRSYEFLDVLRPKLTLFGNAPSEDLAYDAWYSRQLRIVTNNQANCVIVDVGPESMRVFVTNKTFAEKENPWTFYDETLKGWYTFSVS